MACDYQSILAAAKCFECIPPGAQQGIQTYLLSQISGASTNPTALMNAARCIASCIPPGMLNEVKTRLLCEVVDGLAPDIPVVECVPDADAQAFITAAGLTDEVQINAVCQLVADLKAYPDVGTKYWDREVLIYPFVGGNAVAHAVNLKTPGTYDLLFLGATPPNHSAFGVQGQLATSWANTQYLTPAALKDNLRIMWYKTAIASVAIRSEFGARASVGGHWIQQTVDATHPFWFEVNEATLDMSGVFPALLGAYFVQRKEIANKQYSMRNAAWTNIPRASTGTPIDRHLYLFARNGSGAVPAGTAELPCDVRIAGFSLGTVLDVAGGQAEKDEYKGIWDRFNTRLGRGNP